MMGLGDVLGPADGSDLANHPAMKQRLAQGLGRGSENLWRCRRLTKAGPHGVIPRPFRCARQSTRGSFRFAATLCAA